MGGEGFTEDEPAASPVSLYAATKRSCELMSAAYANLYGFPQTGLRFFTVYGPWGRPDMAYFSFTRKILAGESIEVYGQGRMARDRSEEHTSELQSLMRISYAVFCLKKKKKQ